MDLTDKTRRYAKAQEGQTLVIVALSIVVLIAAVAIGVDWGYGLTQRRVMQNEADAAALAAAKLLAGNVVSTASGTEFTVTGDAIYCEALTYARNNRAFGQDSPKEPLLVQWSSNLSATDPWASPAGGQFPAPASCTPPVTTGASVPPQARYIRVQPTVTYAALIAGAVGATNSITASAEAVAALRGAPLPANGPTWPLVRHYTPDAFTSQCGTPCNPTTATPVTFWSSGTNDVDYGTFQGMVDYSRYSTYIASGNPSCYGSPTPATCVPQLIEHWDNSGPPSSPLPNLAGTNNTNVNCAPDNTKWITWGDDINASSGDVAGDDTKCSVPNWATKPFGVDPKDPNTGRLSLTLTHPDAKVDSVRPSVCGANAPPPPLLDPSCTDPTVGDWVETQGGNTGQKLAQPLLQYIQANGTVDPTFSGVVCSSCPNRPLYGKYVTMLVYLWDCAQMHNADNSWTLVEPNGNGTDCSDIHKKGDLGGGQSIDRVHLFTIAPFRFYEGLVTSNSIEGFWGGTVSGDAGCPTCVLNQFSNSVLLVAPN